MALVVRASDTALARRGDLKGAGRTEGLEQNSGCSGCFVKVSSSREGLERHLERQQRELRRRWRLLERRRQQWQQWQQWQQRLMLRLTSWIGLVDTQLRRRRLVLFVLVFPVRDRL